MIELDEKYVVNPAYKFKNDITGVIITNNYSSVFNSTFPLANITTNFDWQMHPYLAWAFSLFNGEKTLNEIFQIFSKKFQLRKHLFIESIQKVIENEEVMLVPLEHYGTYPIPKQFIVRNKNNYYRNDLIKEADIEKILRRLNPNSQRLNIPTSMTLMLNTSCVTNCIYCYADRPHIQNPVSFDRIKTILKEASELDMPSVELDGGDFFLYNNWYNMLYEMRKYGYHPQISTKHPLNKEMVDKLVDLGISRIQLSVDSVNNDEMMKILNVNHDYLDKIKKGISLLDAANIEISIKPVITKHNDSPSSINALINYLSQFKNVKHIIFTPADFSQFKKLSDYCSSIKQINILKNLCDQRNNELDNIEITFLGYGKRLPIETKISEFPHRSLCTGNVSSFFVLPDGKVTICEQMYWHPFFIIGDLTVQSILEMWNSPKALSLWNFSQDEVRDCSPCKKCEEFEKCRRGLGNCWRLAISAYGYDNYDYPAPNCPKSLPITKDMFLN